MSTQSFIQSISLRRLAAIAAWLVVAFIVFATIVPIGLRPRVAMGVAGYERFFAYALAAALLAVAYPNRALRIGIIIISLAVMLEIVQLVEPGRHARVMDAVVKASGTCVGLAIAYALNWRPSRSGNSA